MTRELDNVTLSVIRGKLNQLVNEMDATLVHSAFSPVINEALDMGNGLYRPDGRTITQGDRSLPVFAGNMRFTVESVAQEFEGEFNPDDIVIVNNPYLGGTHLNDVKLVQPYMEDGDVVAFFANTGHWMDIGSAVPGSFNGESKNVYEDGLLIPPLKLYKKGTLNTEVLELILSNVRSRDDIYGDLKAQLNALEVARNRFDDLVDEYDVETLQEAIKHLEESSEERMRSRIDEIPDGSYEFTDYLDNDGVTDEPLPIKLQITVAGSDVSLDFTGSARPAKGPFNAPRSTTISGCHIAFKHIFPEIPINAGCFNPLDYEIPTDSCLDAKPPQATMGYTSVCQRVVDVVFGALSKAIPEKVPAQAFSTSGANRITGITEAGDEYTVGESMAGGYGGSYDLDGLSHCTPPYARARGRGVEVLENRAPIIFTEKGLREDSEGAGRRRGGFGSIYEIELLSGEAAVSLLSDRADFAPNGVAGGKNSKPAHIQFLRGDETYVPPLKTKARDIPFSPGDRFRMESPGGGGYDDPYEREPERVLKDVELGYISIERARDAYGVVIEKERGYKINREKTEKVRSHR